MDMIAYVIRDWQTHGIREVETDDTNHWTYDIGSEHGGRQFILLEGRELELGVDWFWKRAEAEAEIKRLKGLK